MKILWIFLKDCYHCVTFIHSENIYLMPTMCQVLWLEQETVINMMNTFAMPSIWINNHCPNPHALNNYFSQQYIPSACSLPGIVQQALCQISGIFDKNLCFIIVFLPIKELLDISCTTVLKCHNYSPVSTYRELLL